MHRWCLDADSSAAPWRDHDPPGSLLTDKQLARFDADGYCIVEQALAPEVLHSLEHEIDRLEAARNRWLRRQPVRRSWISRADVVDFAPRLVTKSARLRQFSHDRLLTDICRDLIGPAVRLSFDQAVYKRPSTADAVLPLHQDNGYNFKRPEAYITIWIPLHEVGPENGCLRVVPGIHRLGTVEHRVTDDGFIACDVDPEDAVALPVCAGDVVVLSSLTPHSTAGNASSKMRKAYLLSYVADGTTLRDGTLCNADDAQYSVLRNGQRLEA